MEQAQADKNNSAIRPVLFCECLEKDGIVRRVAAALLGGYAFTWGFTALGTTCLVALGMGYAEAEVAMLLLAFLIFLIVFLWAFAAVRIDRVWKVLGGGAVLMTVMAWVMQHLLLH